jgi:branched-chain amino acid aminotransferase
VGSTRLTGLVTAVNGTPQLASLDGEIMDATEAMLPVTDEGLIRGDGAFEVIRVYDGRPFALEEHFARLERSARNLRLPIDLEAVRADAHRLLAESGEAPNREALRIMITRGGRRILLTEHYPSVAPRVRLTTITYNPTLILDGVKSLSYAANMLAGRLAREQGFDDALLVTDGVVLEAPTSSIFWVKDGELLTPPLSDHILASITRAAVIKLTDAQERSCTLADLDAADEAFIASTIREVQGIAAIDERQFAESAPVTERTAQAFTEYVSAELQRT